MYVHHAITDVSQLISESKGKYYSKYYNKLVMKLNNPKTGRKIPIILPLLKHGKLEPDFKIKAISIIFLLLSVLL